MATKVNRAAHSANKRGGRSGRRNRSVFLFKPQKSLNSPVNRSAFESNRHETVARTRNASTGVPTEERAPGIPKGGDYTLPRTDHTSPDEEGSSQRFILTSSALNIHDEIPEENVDDRRSPPLAWGGAPPDSEEFVLICEDLMHPPGVRPTVHWLIYRIPSIVSEIPPNLPSQPEPPSVPGALQGLNSAGHLGYLAPRPPLFDSWHHYRFRLFALDAALKDLRPGMTWGELSAKMTGHILGKTELTGRYRRSRFR